MDENTKKGIQPTAIGLVSLPNRAGMSILAHRAVIAGMVAGAKVVVTDVETRIKDMAGETPIPPTDFREVAIAFERHLGRTIQYPWTLIKASVTVPKGVTCIVDCGPDNARCVAFAVFERGHVRWYGVTASFQEPAELYGVRGYVRAEDAVIPEGI